MGENRNVVDAALRVAREYAAGGQAQDAKVHSGAINSVVPGRTDRLPIHVLSGSFVIPADIVSGLGEGNSTAGMHVLEQMFGPKSSYALAARARGGRTKASPTPVIVAGGEYVIEPQIVEALGDGDINKGHALLDAFVKTQRKKLVKTLRKLPGPAKD